MQWRGPYTVESRVGANDYRVKMGSETKTYHINMLKKYISREPEGNVVKIDDPDGATVAIVGVIHQDVDPELGEVPDLEGYHQREGVRDAKLGDELPKDQRRVLKDLVRRYPDVSKIDLTKGYWQIPVAPEDVHKTAFVTPGGQYEFTRMPFGMVNSGATLVRGLRKILDGMPGVGSYVNDIVIYSDSWEDHIKTLKELFGRLRKARITARPTKCLLGASRMEFLGHQVVR